MSIKIVIDVPEGMTPQDALDEIKVLLMVENSVSRGGQSEDLIEMTESARLVDLPDK